MPIQSFSCRSTFFHHTPCSGMMLMAPSYYFASGMLAISSNPQTV